MRPAPLDKRTLTLQSALEVAVQRRAELAALKASGRPGAGVEALCNGALRTVIRLSLETRRREADEPARGLSKKQLDKVMRLLSQRRVFTNRS